MAAYEFQNTGASGPLTAGGNNSGNVTVGGNPNLVGLASLANSVAAKPTTLIVFAVVGLVAFWIYRKSKR